MKPDLSTKQGSVIYAMKYFGTASAVIWVVLMWDLGGIVWSLFAIVLSYALSILWGLGMWHAIWKDRAAADRQEHIQRERS